MYVIMHCTVRYTPSFSLVGGSGVGGVGEGMEGRGEGEEGMEAEGEGDTVRGKAFSIAPRSIFSTSGDLRYVPVER